MVNWPAGDVQGIAGPARRASQYKFFGGPGFLLYQSVFEP